MRLRIASLITLVCVTIYAANIPNVLSAAGGPLPDIPPHTTKSSSLSVPPTKLSTSTEPVTAMLQIAGPAAIELRDRAAVMAQATRNSAMQAPVEQVLHQLGVHILFQVKLAYNGIAVSVPKDQLATLGTLPNVVAIHVIQPKQHLAATASLTKVQSRLPSSTAATGAGVRVGIIDTGIDYTHADFGGPGTSQAYTSNNPTVIEPNSFPTSKVIGGYDFAGNSYDASGQYGSPLPTPDPDPLDCAGQGTHVAGVVAGFGVTADGTTYTGSYTSTVDTSNFRVQPGVAPEALLYALKVFGCKGTTTLVTQAIERALDPNGDGDPSDHLDILNISVGAPFGNDDDPDSVAVDNAVQAGIVVVSAVGDTGNTFYATSSPASAQLAIAVGASTSTQTTSSTTTYGLSTSTSRGPQRGNGALKPDLVAQGVDVSSAASGSGTESIALSGSAVASPQVTGAAAVLRQLHPTWTPEQIKAALINTAAPVQMADGTTYPPSLGGAGQLNMTQFGTLNLLAYAADEYDSVSLMYGAPWVSQPQQITRTLRLENTSNVTRSVELSATTTVTESGVTITLPPGPIQVPSYTQANVPVSLTIEPSLLDFTPDAATPLRQDNFPRNYLAEVGGYVQFSSRGADESAKGTRVRAIDAAAIPPIAIYIDGQLLEDNLNSGDVRAYHPTTSGSHHVKVVPAGAPASAGALTGADVTFLNDHSYTVIFVGNAKTQLCDIVAVSDTPDVPPSTDQALLYFTNALGIEGWEGVPSVDVYLDNHLQVSGLPPGKTGPFVPVTPGQHNVSFYPTEDNPTGSNLLAVQTFTVNAGDQVLVGAGQRYNSQCEPDDPVCTAQENGFIARDAVLFDTAVVRVPFDLFPKSAAEARVNRPSFLFSSNTTTVSLTLQNTGARNADLDQSPNNAQLPIASAFELAAISPPIGGLNQILRAADVKFLGVTNNLSETQTITSTNIFFGIATYGPWSTPNEIQFSVYIDSNLDGVADYVITNASLGDLVTGVPNDVFFTPLYPSGSDSGISFPLWNTLQPPSAPTGLDTAPFNTSVMFETVSARLIGLTAGKTKFQYRLETRARDANQFNQVVDSVPATGWLQYDLAHTSIAPINLITPLFAQPPRPVFVDISGGQITGVIDPATLAANGGAGMLILHHHNAPPRQAEIVQIRSPKTSPGSVRQEQYLALPLLMAP